MDSHGAPVYFRLLELLLHIDARLVGYALPSGTLALIGRMVYVGRQAPSRSWPHQVSGRLILGITALYTTVVEFGLILGDEFL